MHDTAIDRYEEVAATWRPDRQEVSDVVTTEAPRRFAALLDVDTPVTQMGDPLPPLWHWFLFPEVVPQSELGDDGHPRETALMPPIGPRRRMFGGGRLKVGRPLRCGDDVVRITDVPSVRARAGRSGPLLLVTVRHAYRVQGTECIVEEQDIVYRPPAEADGSPPAPLPTTGGEATAAEAPWTLSIRPDPVLLFRFSALTSNAHRIHYDRPYAREVERHPGLVVHGPLLALLLLELPRRHAPGRTVTDFSWRARSPLYAGQPIHVHGQLDRDEVVLAAGSERSPDSVTGTAAMRGHA